MTDQKNDYYGTGIYDVPKKIVQELVGIDYIEEWETSREQLLEEDNFFNLVSQYDDYDRLIKISGYDYMIVLEDIKDKKIVTEKGEISFQFNYDMGKILVIWENRVLGEIDIAGLAGDLLGEGERQDIDEEKMTVTLENNDIALKLLFNVISGERDSNDQLKIESINARVLFSLKP